MNFGRHHYNGNYNDRFKIFKVLTNILFSFPRTFSKQIMFSYFELYSLWTCFEDWEQILVF